MNISIHASFFLNSVLAAACAAVLFGLPGIAVLQCLGLAGPSARRPCTSAWLMAPAFGMGTFGPFSLSCIDLLGFSIPTLLLSWSLFTAAVWILASRRPIHSAVQGVSDPSTDASARATLLLIFLAAIAAALPAINIYPWMHNGGLYVNAPIFDHVKIAFTDAIAREGLPMHNPFYAPGGERILLSYSYGWYVMAAELKRLTLATGWQVEVALSWYTSLAVVCCLSGLAIRLSRNISAGFWAVVLFLMGPPSANLLPWLLGERFLPLVGLPPVHGLEVSWMQLSWAPQHVYSALAVVILIWMVSIALTDQQVLWRYAIAIGLMAAAAFASSCWVGGVGLLVASPLLIGAMLALRLPWRNYLNLLKILVPAVALCIALNLPLLDGLFSGTSGSGGPRLIGFAIFPSTLLEDHLGLSGAAKMFARIILYWIHLLPLSFGMVYIIGLPAMLLWKPQSLGQKAMLAISLATTIGFLLVSQFIKSTINANDLGWRAVNVPLMLLCVWAAMAMSALFDRSKRDFDHWQAWPMKYRRFFVAGAMGLLALGVAASVRAEWLQAPTDAENVTEHRLFAQQVQAWAVVRKFTKPTDLVASNPDGFPTLVPWPINLPYHLLADRATAYSCIGTGKTYAFRYPELDNHRQYFLMQDAFAFAPKPKTLRALHDRLHVKAIVVTPADAAWNSSAIQDSGLYRKVAATNWYRVYIAQASAKRSG